MSTQTLKRFIILTGITLLFLPMLSSAATISNIDFIPCGTTAHPDMCTWQDVIKMINNIINLLIYAIAAPICAIMFVYAGWLYLSAGDDSGQVTRAHQIFFNVLWGFIVILAAWLIVNFIVSYLVGTDPLMNMLSP